MYFGANCVNVKAGLMYLIQALFGFAFLLLIFSIPAQAADSINPKQLADALSAAFGKAAETIRPSLVTITVGKENAIESSAPATPATPAPTGTPGLSGPVPGLPGPGPDADKMFGSGTGVIVDERGFIVTNNHVVQDGNKIRIQLHTKQTVPGFIAAQDIKSDLALIKIKAQELEPAIIGDSAKVRVGQWVLAAGSPFGLSDSITAGIISACGRAPIGGMAEADFIQTDAAINPGNSGGPLINLDGEVIGINTAIYSRSGGYMGIGFSIPSNRVKAIIDRLIVEFCKAKAGEC